MALIGTFLGLLLGAGLPLLAAPLLAERLPVPADFGVYPGALAEAALYGLLVAFLFTLWPLARARDVRAGELFRDVAARGRAWPPPAYLIAMAGAGGGAGRGGGAAVRGAGARARHGGRRRRRAGRAAARRRRAAARSPAAWGGGG